MSTLIVIPARLQSSRLPEKLLLAESGRTLLEHVHERAAGAGADRVVIAVDDERLRAAAEGFGGQAIMTRSDHTSGTDRVAEAVRALADQGETFDLIVNVQGDEPELDPAIVTKLIDVMGACDDPMGTLAEPIEDPADLARSQVVKVVLDANDRALYFSRATIPAGAALDGPVPPLRHIGLYAYRPAFLQTFCDLDPAPLEGVERLEQLRALYYGHTIKVGVVAPTGARGIDTREDYDAFLARLSD